jgi:hypothetical protein
MPALPNVANVLRADVLWTIGADSSASTRQFFRYSGGAPNSTDATAYAADIYGLVAAMIGLYTSTTVLSGVRVTDLSSASGGQGVHAQATAGNRGTGELPGATCVLVNELISRRYRGGKPRSYWPFGAQTDLNTPQTWSSTLLTTVDSDLATFYAGVIGLAEGSSTITDHVNVSYYNGFTVVTNPVTHRSRNVPTLRTTPVVDVITSFGAATRIAAQRRRN